MATLAEPAGVRPVMTFCVNDDWIAVRVDQMESVALAPRLWPVPFTSDDYVGLYDRGDDLVPVMQLQPHQSTTGADAQLLAILHVRGESVGLAINEAGRVHDHYWFDENPSETPFDTVPCRLMRTNDQRFWLIDTDRLWQSPAEPAPVEDRR